jgi:hypothetical protein
MVEIYGIGMILTFIISVVLCRWDEKRYNSKMQYEMCTMIALFSWIGLIGLGIAYREDIRKLFNHK